MYSKVYEQYLADLNSQTMTAPPAWYKDLTKTLSSRNVTISDWNDLQLITRKLASNNNLVVGLIVELKRLLDTLNDNFTDTNVGELTVKYSELNVAVIALNELVKGLQKAMSYDSYTDMRTALEGMSSNTLSVGQAIFIKTLNVPDVWVYAKHTTEVWDPENVADYATRLNTSGTVRVGHYELSKLETAKLNLDEVASKTDLNALHAALAELADKVNNITNDGLTDSAVTETSSNPVKSSGVYTFVHTVVAGALQSNLAYWKEQNTNTNFTLRVGPLADYVERENEIYIPEDDNSFEEVLAKVNALKTSAARVTKFDSFPVGSLVVVGVRPPNDPEGNIPIGTTTGMYCPIYHLPNYVEFAQLPFYLYGDPDDPDKDLVSGIPVISKTYLQGTWTCIGLCGKITGFYLIEDGAVLYLWQRVL